MTVKTKRLFQYGVQIKYNHLLETMIEIAGILAVNVKDLINSTIDNK